MGCTEGAYRPSRPSRSSHIQTCNCRTMEKPTKLTLEIKSHRIEFGFKGGGVQRIYVEDSIDEGTATVIDGFKAWLAKVSGPGFIEIRKNFFRPHSDIGYIELKESTVTQVVTMEKQEDGSYVIANIE